MPILIRLGFLLGLWGLNRWRSRSEPPLVAEVGALSWTAKGRLVWRLIKDSRVPAWSRGLAVLPALYLISPIDLLPDFIPFIGRLDDALVFSLTSDLLLRFVPDDVLREHLASVATPKFATV